MKIFCHPCFSVIEHGSGHRNEKIDPKKTPFCTLYCYELPCSVRGLRSYFKRSFKIPKSYGTWQLSLKFSSKPPFYPRFSTFIPQIVGALGVFLVVHVRVDIYVTPSGPRLHASGANSMQISVKYPETQMSVLACTVSYAHLYVTMSNIPEAKSGQSCGFMRPP